MLPAWQVDNAPLTFVSVANVRSAVSLLSARENGRHESLLLQAMQWKLVEITLKIALIFPDFQISSKIKLTTARDCLSPRLWNFGTLMQAGQQSLLWACAITRIRGCEMDAMMKLTNRAQKK